MASRDPSGTRPGRPALLERSDRRGMEVTRAIPAATRQDRSISAQQIRGLIKAIFFVLRGGVPWRMLPEHFPPHRTICRWFMRFRDDGTWKNLDHHLVMLDRRHAGHEASPSAGVIDIQSVKTTEAGVRRGIDAAKKIKGGRRHAVADTDGRS